MPDFLLVGAACSSAETLLDWLGRHPQIHASPIAETNYFVSGELGTEGVMDKALLSPPRPGADGEFTRADVGHISRQEDYERCFYTPGKAGALRRGEASPAYGFYRGAARRISEEIPHCKIVFVLRDPVARALANYALLEAQGREHLTLEDALEHEPGRQAEKWSHHWSYLGLSSYVAALTRFLARFPVHGIHLVRAESLESPALRPAAWRALLNFLEVDVEVPLPERAQSAGAFCLPAAQPVGGVSEHTRRLLAARLQTETNFYRAVFSEAPFDRATLRALAGGVPSADDNRGAVSGREHPAAGAVFQHLLLSSDPFRDALYHHKISHNRSAHPRMTSAGAMQFLKDEIFSFDSFFNAFFESLAAERTGLRSIQLRLEFSGRFFVEVFRLAGGRAPQLIRCEESERRQGDGPLILELDLTTDSPLGSRLVFNLTCLSREGRFLGGSWWTTAAPRRPVQLEILTCTYKKREFVERTVRRVAEYRRLDRREYFITVVDNGRDLPEKGFPYPNVRVVHQGNSGCTGGVARGMMEAMAAQDRPQPTHFLIMDDDIELEPDMVLRAMSWLRHVKEDQCIGGGMLDLYHPTQLYELGSWLGRPKVFSVTACVTDLELAKPASLDKLGTMPEPNYNAWWFMAISRDAVEKHGLPLPCFIRGDDKEYGLRMQQKGVRTFSVPGLAVWHLPFYIKVSPWLFYFNMYNDLLIRTFRNPELTGETMAQAVWEEIEHYLEKLEYDHAAVRVLGLEHFLLGPQWLLDSDPEARFREIMVASKEFAGEHRRDVEPKKFDTHYNPKTQFDMRWRRWIHNGHLPLKWRKPVYTSGGVPRKVIQAGEWGWTDVTYFDEIGVKHPLIPGIFVFRKRPEVYFDLLRRAKAGVETLRREWTRRAAEFRKFEAELVSPAFWRRHLRLTEMEANPDQEDSGQIFPAVPVRPAAKPAASAAGRVYAGV